MNITYRCFSLLTICFFISKSTNAQKDVEFALPIIDAYSTDIGAESGDLELNYFTGMTKKGSSNFFAHAIEIEFTPNKGFGFEFAWLNNPSILTDNELAPDHDFVELTGQFSHIFKEKTAFATGLEVEKSISVRKFPANEAKLGLRPFLRVATVFKEHIHLQAGISTEIEISETTEIVPNYTAATFYNWDDLQCGFELNGVLGEEKKLELTPQFAFKTGHLTIATGLILPILNEKSESLDLTTRPTLGIAPKPLPGFIARVTVSFEHEN
jgi:hypothetical protein